MESSKAAAAAAEVQAVVVEVPAVVVADAGALVAEGLAAAVVVEDLVSVVAGTPIVAVPGAWIAPGPSDCAAQDRVRTAADVAEGQMALDKAPPLLAAVVAAAPWPTRHRQHPPG